MKCPGGEVSKEYDITRRGGAYRCSTSCKTTRYNISSILLQLAEETLERPTSAEEPPGNTGKARSAPDHSTLLRTKQPQH